MVVGSIWVSSPCVVHLALCGSTVPTARVGVALALVLPPVAKVGLLLSLNARGELCDDGLGLADSRRVQSGLLGCLLSGLEGSDVVLVELDHTGGLISLLVALLPVASVPFAICVGCRTSPDLDGDVWEVLSTTATGP